MDNSVKIWNIINGKLTKILKDHKLVVRDVEFSPNGQLIATSSDDTNVKLWTRNGLLLRTLEGHKS